MFFSKSILINALGVFATLSQGAVATEFRDDVHVLMYETDASLSEQPDSSLHFFKERSAMAGLRTTVYGSNLPYRGFGDKYQVSLRPILEIMNQKKQDTLVILADARDVALNLPTDEDMAALAIDHFVENFKRATKDSPDAVVVSAESQCCVSAMSHAQPWEYFDAVSRKRNKRACYSGKEGCRWSENENIFNWVDFMHKRASEATGMPVQEIGDIYLNAGLMAGYPKDLIKLIDALDLEPDEDDQAVLSGLMYSHPEMLVLDYGQDLFGNNQWTRGVEDGCVFEGYGPESALVHFETGTQPLIIHTSGKFYACLDLLIEALGGQSQQRYNPNSRMLLSGRLSLAAQLGLGGSASAAAAAEEAVLVEAVATLKPTNKASAETTIEPTEPAGESGEETVTNYGYGESTYGVSNYGVYSHLENNGPKNYGSSSETNYGYGSYGVARRARSRRTA